METWSVPRAWPGATAVILASGPSLSREQLEHVQRERWRLRVIAINNTGFAAPWADVLYACDDLWWMANRWGRDFPGLKVSHAENDMAGILAKEGVRLLRLVTREPRPHQGRGAAGGLSLDPGAIVSGKSSGYQAINLAVLLGAKRIVLLGYDMKSRADGQHHHYPNAEARKGDCAPNYPQFLERMATLPPALAAAGVEVVNATPGSALTCFPMQPLAEALA